MRVVTTEGNTFHTHKVIKESVWTVPDEIKDAVVALEQREAEEKEQEAQEEDQDDRRIEVDREVERKSEVHDLVGKRKAEEPVPVDELVISKKARVEDVEEEEDEEDDESEEEDWQREAAA